MALLVSAMKGFRIGGSHRRRFQLHHLGFTLVELAIVVAVIALLLGSLLVPLTTQVEQRNVADTDTRLAQAQQALVGYAMLNGRLPRPAVSAANGTEQGACASEVACTGYLPWASLGVSQTDAWGKVLRYSVSPEFANAPFNLSTVATNPKTVFTRDAAGTQMALASGVVAVVMSYGAYNFGTTVDGTNIANSSATNTDEQNNDTEFNSCGWVANCTSFWGRPVATNTGAAGGEFDDRVVWVSKNVLFSQMVSAGKLP
jgi:prepilin-type N-terminal cleavage/methylation domain-containing protein